MTRYDFLIDTYATERIKVLSVWSEFRDSDLPVRPHPSDRRGRSVLEQMVHQCMSEDLWFRNMLGIDAGIPPVPQQETRMGFIRQYNTAGERRLLGLRQKDEEWWEEEVPFFDVRRSRAWIMSRRLNHTSHHRGQLMAMLRMLGRSIHSNYGPTADTGGLMADHASTIYAYPDLKTLVEGEEAGGRKSVFPGVGKNPVTERPDSTGEPT